MDPNLLLSNIFSWNLFKKTNLKIVNQASCRSSFAQCCECKGCCDSWTSQLWGFLSCTNLWRHSKQRSAQPNYILLFSNLDVLALLCAGKPEAVTDIHLLIFINRVCSYIMFSWRMYGHACAPQVFYHSRFNSLSVLCHMNCPAFKTSKGSFKLLCSDPTAV